LDQARTINAGWRNKRSYTKVTQKPVRDIEKDYPLPEFIEKLRHFADTLAQRQRVEIQIAGGRISVPVRATNNIAHDRDDDEEEIEFQIKWSL
jgi:amphi-Trp domain-containing protein